MRFSPTNSGSRTIYFFLMLSVVITLLAACGDVVLTTPGLAGAVPTASPTPSAVANMAPTLPSSSPTPTIIAPTATASATNPAPTLTPVATIAVPIGPVTGKIGTPFALARNQIARIEPDNLDIRFLRVLEDSRCPVNVACAWSGQLIIEVSVARPGFPADTIKLNNIEATRNKDRPNFENYNLALVSAKPDNYYQAASPVAGQTDKVGLVREYVVQLLVTKLNTGILPAAKAELGQLVQLKYQQTAFFAREGLSLKFEDLLNESRCPRNSGGYFVACATSGKATIRLQAEHGQAKDTLNLTIPGLTEDTTRLKTATPDAIFTGTFAGYRVQLVTLEPQPETGTTTTKAAAQLYQAIVLVTKL